VTPLRMTTWFRRRMALLVIVSTGVAWATTTASYHAHERRELLAMCRGDAERIATVVGDSVQQRPRLWRYDAAKMADRIADFAGGDQTVIAVRDARGASVDLGTSDTPGLPRAIWGRAEVRVGGKVAARVWIGRSTTMLWWRTLLVGALAALVSLGLGSLLYLLPVRAVSTAERRAAALMEQLAIVGRDDERRRIALDLHDGAGQALTAARLHLAALENGSPESEHLRPIVALVNQALDEVRRSTSALAPLALAELGLASAIRRLCESSTPDAAPAITCRIVTPLPRVPTHAETAIYRMTQEALTNIVKHAHAQHASVDLGAEGGVLRLRVTDDGEGLSDETTARGGMGMVSLRARAASIGAEVRLLSADPGTILEVVLPLPEETT